VTDDRVVKDPAVDSILQKFAIKIEHACGDVEGSKIIDMNSNRVLDLGCITVPLNPKDRSRSLTKYYVVYDNALVGPLYFPPNGLQSPVVNITKYIKSMREIPDGYDVTLKAENPGDGNVKLIIGITLR